MRTTIFLLLLFLSPLAARGDGEAPSVTLPATLTVRAGRLTVIEAKTNGKVVKWLITGIPRDQVDLRPLSSDGTSLAFVPDFNAGKNCYLIAYTALGDVPSDFAVCAVKIDSSSGGGGDPSGPTNVLASRTRDALRGPDHTASPEEVGAAWIIFGAFDSIAHELEDKPQLLPSLKSLRDELGKSLKAAGWKGTAYQALTDIMKDEFGVEDVTFTPESRKQVIEKLRNIAQGAKSAAISAKENQ